MWTRCLRGNHVECCQGQVVGRFIIGHPIRNQQKAEAVLSPQGGVGGCCRVLGCVLFLNSMPETLGARQPCGLGWGPQGSQAPVEVSQEVAETEGKHLRKQVGGGVAFTLCCLFLVREPL